MSQQPEQASLQDTYFAGLTCFGCGPSNTKGLRLKSYLSADPADEGLVVATFRPWPEHDNGLGYLNGGIVTTLLDCHSASVVTHSAFQNGWNTLSGGLLPYVTAGLDVRFLRPSPLRDQVHLRAHVTEAAERQIVAEVELWWQDKVRAAATATWKRWRPR